MRGRQYYRDKIVTPLPAKPQGNSEQLEPWEDGQILHDLREASAILTRKLGRGYSPDELRRKIRTGQWIKGYHWFKPNKYYKISVRRAIATETGA